MLRGSLYPEAVLTWGPSSRFPSVGSWGPVLIGTEQPLPTSAMLWGPISGVHVPRPHRNTNTSPLCSPKGHTPLLGLLIDTSLNHQMGTGPLKSQGSPPLPDNFSIWPETQTKDCYFPHRDKESSNLKNSKASSFRRVKEKVHISSCILISQQPKRWKKETQLVNSLFLYSRWPRAHLPHISVCGNRRS